MSIFVEVRRGLKSVSKRILLNALPAVDFCRLTNQNNRDRTWRDLQFASSKISYIYIYNIICRCLYIFLNRRDKTIERYSEGIYVLGVFSGYICIKSWNASVPLPPLSQHVFKWK